MLNLQKILIERLAQELKDGYQQTYNAMEPQYRNIIGWLAQLALENIANSDTLYHDVDHTIMVTLVGQSIIRGKHLREGGVAPKDWLHYLMALLFHDIGYVRGICSADDGNLFATGIGAEMFQPPRGGTDVALTPYHVDRSKLFVRERFGGTLFFDIDAEAVASYIEMTRFPMPDDDFYKDTQGYGGLVRAADFIGQLGAPNYLQKIPALFYEFEETGENAKRDYKSPGDMRNNYAKFYWNVVSPYLQDALVYLRVTQEGKMWVANLHSHVFDVEHGSTNPS